MLEATCISRELRSDCEIDPGSRGVNVRLAPRYSHIESKFVLGVNEEFMTV